MTFEKAKGCDLLHTLNAVPIRTKLPYLITFESYLPRVPDDRYIPWLESRLFERLAKPRCKRLIAFSDYALNQFRTQIGRYQGYEPLLQKTEILYPAITPRSEEPKQHSNAVLRLLYVGRQFMHKGGPAVLRAHEQLRAQGLEVETTVVSALDWDANGLVGPDSKQIVQAEHDRLKQPGITYIDRAPNERVLRLMREADFLLLPTINDTFGFVCLEALAHGTPVIATNTCALPEIVDHHISGFLLDMPNDEQTRRWTGLKERRSRNYDRLYVELIEDLAKQIVERLANFKRDDYAEMSRACLDTVRTRFNHDKARERLEEIYAEAAGRA
jgi:glycosyltransferase involved in cell wall biosynthesis